MGSFTPNSASILSISALSGERNIALTPSICPLRIVEIAKTDGATAAGTPASNQAIKVIAINFSSALVAVIVPLSVISSIAEILRNS
jgi:hypothetical protein